MCNLCLNRVTHKISTLTFDSTKFEKSGSKPIAKRTYRFTYENGTNFILPCISDSAQTPLMIMPLLITRLMLMIGNCLNGLT